MIWFWIGVAGAAVLLLSLLIAYICYRMAFYEPNQPKTDPDAVDIPVGRIYEPYRENMEKWIRETRAMPRKSYSITSFDGLKLYAYYYEYAPDAPVEIMFHGYRGNSERDLPGGVQRSFRAGHSALVVDQRCGGRSEGHVISFGINEHRDCLAWVDFAVKQFGADVKLILTGISMGAATVLMAAGKPLPPQVIGVLADCGYSSPKEIICKVIRDMHLPPRAIYPFVKLGARLFGHFDLEETSPLQAMENCKVPVIFYHGESDAFVPCDMSRAVYEACPTRKRIVTIPEAGHGLCYAVDPTLYIHTLREFYPE